MYHQDNPIVDYSSLLRNNSFLPSYRELRIEGLSLSQNFLYWLKRIIILPHNYYDFIAAYAFIPSVLAKVVPYLFLYGTSGSGKSTIGKLIAIANGVSINSSADTFAGIRNSLNARKYERLYIPSDDPEYPGTFKEGIEQNTIMVWDDIDRSVFIRSPDIYRLFKFGYDRSSSQIQISSEKAGNNLKFDCFCPKVFSSVHPFHTDSEFSEFKRRLLTVPTARAEDMKGVNLDNLLDLYEWDWTGLETEIKQYWTYQKAEEYLRTRKTVSRGLRLKSEQKIICVDFATTAIVTGIWSSISEANTRLDDYFAWLKAETEEERDNLEKMLSQLIAQEMTEAKAQGRAECRIYVSRLRRLAVSWYEQGYLLEPADRKQIKQFMKENGFKGSDSGAWVKKF
jgi:hypothetical protein